MKDLELSPVLKSKFKNTTDSRHTLKVSLNIINREFTASELGKVWVSDITYIRLKYSFVHLTTVIDLADRMVVGWSFKY
jgi:transposase InsO family protein